MKRESVIIWGIGSGYKKREKLIKNKCNITAFTGNQPKPIGIELEAPYIVPQEIHTISFDKIVICSIPFYETIKYQLIVNHHILEHKIACITDYITTEEARNTEVESIIFQSVDLYKEQNKTPEFVIKDEDMWLLCDDYTESAGSINKTYFSQDIWAAQKIHQTGIQEHHDIGSRLDGFLAHVLVFCSKVNYLDIRPLKEKIPGLYFVQADATNLETIDSNSIQSLSSLHAVEHFGLGRYGDPIDSEACFKAMKAFQRVLKPGGKLYFSVPIGPESKLIFNAHRIFSPMTVIRAFNELELLEFSYVKECNIISILLPELEEQTKKIPEYSVGLFEFYKKE